MEGSGDEGVGVGDRGAKGGVCAEVFRTRREEVRRKTGFWDCYTADESSDQGFEGGDSCVGEGKARRMHGRRRV